MVRYCSNSVDGVGVCAHAVVTVKTASSSVTEIRLNKGDCLVLFISMFICSYLVSEIIPWSTFILLRIDARGTLEVAAEIGGVGKTELVGGFLDRLVGMHVHDSFGLCRHILLNPFQGREAIAELAEHFREITGVVAHQLGIEIDIAVLPVVLYHQVAELCVQWIEGRFPDSLYLYQNKSECVPVLRKRSVNSVSFCSQVINQSGSMWHSQVSTR